MASGLLPQIGLGTSSNDDPEECANTVATALEAGYRHVDTAQLYGNESYVGDGIERASVPREDVLVATKVHEAKNAYDDVIKSTNESLQKLGLDRIDLLYVHFPINDYEPAETLSAFNDLYKEGVFRYVAVSNFSAKQVETALEHLDVPLVANQVEMHPLLPPREPHLESACRHDYQLVGYSPFCRGEVFGTPEIRSVAEKHGVSQAQVCLAWLLTHDHVTTIPKGTSRNHLVDNLDARMLKLDRSDVDRIDGIEQEYRRFDRDGAPWNE